MLALRLHAGEFKWLFVVAHHLGDGQTDSITKKALDSRRGRYYSVHKCGHGHAYAMHNKLCDLMVRLMNINSNYHCWWRIFCMLDDERQPETSNVIGETFPSGKWLTLKLHTLPNVTVFSSKVLLDVLRCEHLRPDLPIDLMLVLRPTNGFTTITYKTLHQTLLKPWLCPYPSLCYHD